MPSPSVTPVQRLQGSAARAVGRLPGWLQRRLSGRPPVVIDGQVLDPQLQLVLAIRHLRGPVQLVGPTPAAARRRFRREMATYRGRPTRVDDVRDFTIPGGDGQPLRVRHYAPLERTGAGGLDRRAPLLVYLHGGGFVIGDLDTHDEACRLLCRHGALHVLSVDYRLAPEHPFPAALDDARAALRWAREHAASLGADAARVALGGDSAGANLTAAAALLERDARNRGRRDAPPAAQLLVYPPTDWSGTPWPSRALFATGFLLGTGDRNASAHYYLDGAGVAHGDPRVAPLLAPDLSRLPPALVVTAGFDILRDEGEAYADALAAAGNVVRARRYASLPHGFVNLTGVCRTARQAMIEIAGELRALLEEARD